MSAKIQHLVIRDAQGALVLEKKNIDSGHTENIAHWSNGMYTVEITTAKGPPLEKLIKNE